MDKDNYIDNNQTSIENAQITVSDEVPKASKNKPINKKIFFVFFIALILTLSLVVFFKSDSSFSQDKITGQAADVPHFEAEEKSFGDEESAVQDDKKTSPAEEPLDARKETKNLENYDDVLLEEVRKQKIEVSDKEVDGYIQKSLEAYDMSEDELKQYLQDYGITYQQYKEKLKSKLTISELVNENVDLDSVKVSEKEVNEFIEDNENEYQDVINDEETYEVLKSRVKFKLLADKQTELVMDYIDNLQ